MAQTKTDPKKGTELVPVAAPNATQPVSEGTQGLVVVRHYYVTLMPGSCLVTCPSCGARVRTRVNYTYNLQTHLSAALLCLLGCWFCICIPYFMDSCRNSNHYCPNCNAFMGTYPEDPHCNSSVVPM